MWLVRIGSKVTGPYSLEDLRKLRQRRQFSPVHQVSSTGGDRWESAAQLIEMIDGEQRQWTPPTNSRAAGGSTSDPALSSSSVGSRSRWYYVDADQKQVGPVTEDALRDLLRLRRLNPRVMVCREGDANWEEARERAEFAAVLPKSSNLALYLVSGFAAIVIVTSLAVLVMRTSKHSESQSAQGGDANAVALSQTANYSAASDPVKNTEPSTLSKSPKTSGKAAAGPPGDLLLSSLDDEKRVAQAVGLVVVCERTHFAGGAMWELAKSTGSCFAVTPSGYLLTNRHVVDSVSPKKPAKIKIGDEIQDVQSEVSAIIYFNHVRRNATVKHISTRFDLAILKIERETPQVHFALSAGDVFKRRLEVSAVGFPGVAGRAENGEQQMIDKVVLDQLRDAYIHNTSLPADKFLAKSAFDFTVTDGRITKMLTMPDGQSAIYHEARIFGGNSGGPLIDSAATVIGINTELKRDLTSISDDKIISDGNVYRAYTTGQFRDEINEFVPDPIVWRD